jgi:hypothetical protein
VSQDSSEVKSQSTAPAGRRPGSAAVVIGAIAFLFFALWLILRIVTAILGLTGHEANQLLNHFEPPAGLVNDETTFWALYGIYLVLLSVLYGALYVTLYDTGDKFVVALKVLGTFLFFALAPLPFFLVHLPPGQTTQLFKGQCGPWLRPSASAPVACREVFNSAASIADVFILIGIACPFAVIAYQRWWPKTDAKRGPPASHQPRSA